MKLVDIFFICLVISSLCVQVSTIDCWVCSSNDAGCGESIDEAILQDNKKTSSGCAGCGKTFKSLGTVWSQVVRTCLTTSTDTCDNKLGYGECTCSTTFCNGQTTVKVTPAIMFLLSVLIVVL